ncbi:hypothetical protein EDD21DRAFT_379422 [Dissophora ornata]|nr:hypothetical protein BGZ58_008599 [Dissophora ornata]KAI8599577.1 hypothetical protein EDD21DRAFT_379422 [Dissophora ornata]
MGAILHVRKKSLLALAISIFITILLLGPVLFIHFPRTCIPHVDYYNDSNNNDNRLTNPNPHPSIVILSGERCTATSPESKCRFLGELSFHNRREYVAHHKGRYALHDNFTSHFENVVSQGYVPAWAKISILLEELERDEHDWIFWIDTDALIANMDIELERFVDDRYSLIVTKDRNSLNAGVFMLKVNDWSRRYMRAIMDRIDKVNNEQDWMIALLENEDHAFDAQRNVKYLPQCSFNSYWEVKTLHEMYRPGDFVVHWAGHNFSPASFKDWRLARFIKLPF